MTPSRKSRFSESLMKARSKGEISSPSVISLYGVHRVTVEPSDEMKEMFQKTYTTLEEINTTLQKLASYDKATSQIVEEAISEPVCKHGTVEEIDEPAELSVNIPEPLIEPDKPYGHIVYRGDLPDDWHPWRNIKWMEDPTAEEGKQLRIKYRSDSFGTSWDVMKRLAREPDKSRIGKIRNVLGPDWTNNKRTGLNQFAIALAMGEITQPENPENELMENIAAFQEEEDPDSVFKPMLNAYSTRPDPNCGKIEGSLEVI